MRLKFHALALTAVAVLLSVLYPAGANQAPLPAEVANDNAFNTWVVDMADAVAQDPQYRRIPLDTPARTNEFMVVLHRLFRGRMTEAEFMVWVDARYPGHAYETATIIRFMHAHLRGGGR